MTLYIAPRILFISMLFLFGCATSPLKPVGPIKEGVWRAKALIKDKEQNRSYIVNLNLNAVRDGRARMDVTSTLGTGVASMVISKDEVRYILFDAKRFYFGVPKPDVMRPILNIPFDPRWLHNLLFDLPITDKGWECRKNNLDQPDSCVDSSGQTKVAWASRNGDKRTVSIDHPKGSVQINIQSFQPKVEDRQNLFDLEAPEGFQKLRVR
jgi:hypothetical protein